MARKFQNEKKNTSFGSTYVGLSPELVDLYKEWNKKLKQSGFDDIEYKSDSGLVSGYFKDGGNALTLQQNYDEDVEFYYSKCREFLSTADWSELFAENALFYRYLWALYSEGVNYRAIAKIFNGQKPKKFKQYKVHYSLKRNHSHYYYFAHCHKIKDIFWQWMGDEAQLDDVRAFRGSSRLITGKLKQK